MISLLLLLKRIYKYKLEPEARTIALIWKFYFDLFGLFDSIAITHLRKVSLITVEDYVELQEELWYNKSD